MGILTLANSKILVFAKEVLVVCEIEGKKIYGIMSIEFKHLKVKLNDKYRKNGKYIYL